MIPYVIAWMVAFIVVVVLDVKLADNDEVDEGVGAGLVIATALVFSFIVSMCNYEVVDPLRDRVDTFVADSLATACADSLAVRADTLVYLREEPACVEVVLGAEAER